MSFLFLISTFFSAILLSCDTSKNFPPPLEKNREKELFDLYEKNGDENARMLLIEHNLRLVAHIVRKYYGTSDMAEDLVSIGTIGLIKAVDSFKLDTGVRFATYASRCIQNEILMFFRSKKKNAMEISINQTIDTDRDGNPLTYMDIIKCEDTIADDLDVKLKIAKSLDYIKTKLDKREREVIVFRYGLDGNMPLTQRETADKIGISRSYVSRIEKCVLEKLANYLRGKE